MNTAQKWQKTLAWLRRNFPPPYPVIVRSIPIRKFHGDTAYEDSGWFRMRINRKKSFNLRIDTIIHEWAHVLTWFGAEVHEDHSAEWGMAYARIYRTFIEWNYGKGPEEEE